MKDPKKRRNRRLLLLLIAGFSLVGFLSWRKLAIVYCSTVALQASDGSVVAWNAGALAHLGMDSLPSLCHLVSRPDVQQAWAGGAGIWMLYRDNKDRRPELLKLLEHENPRVRGAMAMILVWFKDPLGVPKLIEFLDSEDPDLSFFSAVYLTHFPGAQFHTLVKDPGHVYQKMVSVLYAALDDDRKFYVFSGIRGFTVRGYHSSIRSYANQGLDPLIRRAEDDSHNDTVLRDKAKLIVEAKSGAVFYEKAREEKASFFVEKPPSSPNPPATSNSRPNSRHNSHPPE